MATPGAIGFCNSYFDVVFELDDGAAQILDPASVGISAYTAYDVDGNVLPGATAQIVGIR